MEVLDRTFLVVFKTILVLANALANRHEFQVFVPTVLGIRLPGLVCLLQDAATLLHNELKPGKLSMRLKEKKLILA